MGRKWGWGHLHFLVWLIKKSKYGKESPNRDFTATPRAPAPYPNLPRKIERPTALRNIDFPAIRMVYSVLPNPAFTHYDFSILRALGRILMLEVTNLYMIFFAC